MKKLFSFVLIFFTLLFFTISVSAEFENKLLFDEGDFYTLDEETTVYNALNESSQNCGFEILVLTTENYDTKLRWGTSGYSVEEMNNLSKKYCDEYIRSIGKSTSDDCIVLLRYISEYNKDDKYVYIVPYGELSAIFDGGKINRLLDSLEPYFSSGNDIKAFETFADEVYDIYLKRNNIPVEGIFISLSIALVISLIVVMTMKGKLKSVRVQPYASNYLKQGSFKLKNSKDIFLYRTVTCVRVQQNSGGGGRIGGGGGSRGGGRRM